MKYEDENENTKVTVDSKIVDDFFEVRAMITDKNNQDTWGYQQRVPYYGTSIEERTLILNRVIRHAMIEYAQRVEVFR